METTTDPTPQPTRPTLALEEALATQATQARYALDTLSEWLDENQDETDVEAARVTLKEAIDLVHVLRRLVRGRSVPEIHAAFGAPGDFGYETETGAALAALYSAHVAARQGATP